MEIFKQDLISQAGHAGFDPKILEKDGDSCPFYKELISTPYLKSRLALKAEQL